MALDDETQIKEIFDYIDKDGDGEMDLQEFKEGFGYLKEKISQQRLARRPRPAPHSYYSLRHRLLARVPGASDSRTQAASGARRWFAAEHAPSIRGLLGLEDAISWPRLKYTPPERFFGVLL